MTASHFALLVFKIVVGWTLASVIFGTLGCWLITRGKMDSHRRQHGACGRNADGLGCLSVGAEIDNTSHVERF